MPGAKGNLVSPVGYDVNGTPLTYPTTLSGRPIVVDKGLLFYEDFELGSTAWTQVRGAVAVSAVVAHMGKQSLEITTPAVAHDYGAVSKYGFYFTGKVGLELYFCASTHIEEVRFYYSKILDGVSMRGYVRFVFATKKLELTEDGGTSWETVETLTNGLFCNDTYNPFHQIRVVIDWSTQMFVSIELNGVVYDCSSYSLNVTASAVGDTPYFMVRAYTDRAAADSMWIDEVKLTEE